MSVTSCVCCCAAFAGPTYRASRDVPGLLGAAPGSAQQVLQQIVVMVLASLGAAPLRSLAYCKLWVLGGLMCVFTYRKRAVRVLPVRGFLERATYVCGDGAVCHVEGWLHEGCVKALVALGGIVPVHHIGCHIVRRAPAVGTVVQSTSVWPACRGGAVQERLYAENSCMSQMAVRPPSALHFSCACHA